MKPTTTLNLTETTDRRLKIIMPIIESKNLNILKSGGLCYITFPSLSVDGVKHAFSTRLGGKSEGIFSSMNLSFSRGDDPQNVLENYRIICKAINVDYKKCVLSKQTHTTNIRIVTLDDIGKGIVKERDFDDVDGLITDIPGVTLVTQYADCVGLLFYDPVKKVIAASHAGWRGTVGEIGRKTVETMQSHFGSDPKNILAAIAPSIGPCCFEVDSPVYDEFIKLKNIDLNRIIKGKPNGKYNIDLWECNRQILINAGVDPENISVTDLCTKCHPDVFFSHRATKGKRGNLAALICLDEVSK